MNIAKLLEYYWPGCLWELVGNDQTDYKNLTCDIGILIGYPGKGFGKVAWKKMIDFLLKKKFRKISGGCMSNNTAMIKIFKSSGMKFEYKKRKQYFHPKLW